MAMASSSTPASSSRESSSSAFQDFMQRMAGLRKNGDNDVDLQLDKTPAATYNEDLTPARTFFVRMVAQREIEVNESQWFEVLKRHGVDPNPSNGPAISVDASGRSLPSYRDYDYRDSEKSLMRTKAGK